jgi:cytoskeleton protein RodZ
MKAADYNDIGHYLKDSRESLKISVVEAAAAMHIRTHYIEAMESGNWEILPGKAYVRGYIKNYALYLGINANELLAAYDALSGTVKQELYIPEPTVRENLPSQSLMMIVLGAALLMLGIYVLFMREARILPPTVADVPASLLFAVERGKNPRIAEWMECLNTNVNECFNLLIARDTLAGIEQGHGETIKYLSGI